MAENEVRIVNGTTGTTPLFASTVANPAIDGVYIHSIAAVPGTVALQNFITLYNPIGSGRMLSLGEVAISFANTATAGSLDPIRGHRISVAPTGGVLVATSAIAKFSSAQPDPVGVVRTGNPTVTLGTPVFNSPPPIDNKSSDVHNVEVPPGAGPFLMAPGEGLAISKATGAVSVAWNITIVWAEL